jgi:hypothetical protein
VCDCRNGNDAEDLETPSTTNTTNTERVKKALSRFIKPKNKNIDTEIKG